MFLVEKMGFNVSVTVFPKTKILKGILKLRDFGGFYLITNLLLVKV